MNVGAGHAQFGESKQKCVIFNYFDKNGNVVNYKARSIHQKMFTQKSGGVQQFYNLHNVLASDLAEVFIVEGEMDALALIESGIPPSQVLSVPSGAPQTASENLAASRKYSYVATGLADGLDKCKKFIIATDNDSAGRILRDDLAHLLGAGRCQYVQWPEGVKDANDALIQWDSESLQFFMREDPRDMPLEGVFLMSEIPEPPAFIRWRGFDEWDNKLIFAPTCMSVMSGWPGHGKSHLSQQIWCKIAQRHDIRVAIMSMETREKPFVRRNLRSALIEKQEKDMTDAEKERADSFIEDHFVFIHHPKNMPDFNWLTDVIYDCHLRYGVNAVSIDPFNMIVPDFNKTVQTETSWIGQCLDSCTYLAKSCNLHMQILAHPAKPVGANSREPISYSSIAGSQHWANKPDQVMSIHRDKFTDEFGGRATDSRLIVHKSRYEELGYPCELKMNLNLLRGTFECTEYASF